MAEFNPMDPNELRRQGGMVLERMARYWEELKTLKPIPDVQPGFLEKLMPKEAPDHFESLEEVLKDFDEIVMPGVTHWHSPYFCSYYPTSNSVPAICGDIISSALGIIGFSWESCPSCTELEMLMMKWLGRLLGLPEHFYEGSKGGGIIQCSASDSILIAYLSARSKAISKKNVTDPNNMVAYFSEEAHCSVSRAAKILLIQGRKIGIDSKGSMCAKLLEEQIEKDLAAGLTPILCVACLGTTSMCFFDKLDCLGPVCEKYDMWLHVDAAYAGCAFVCPEYRYLMKGIEYVDTFNTNVHKWLLVNFDCSPLWFKDISYMAENFRENPLYLDHENQDSVVDYRHLQIPLGRRFRSLKLWFVMRLVGKGGLKQYIRKSIGLAKLFESMVRKDNDFEVVNEVLMGLVCFRLKSGNVETEKISKEIKNDRRLFLTTSQTGGLFYMRFAVCSSLMKEEHVVNAWNILKDIQNKINLK